MRVKSSLTRPRVRRRNAKGNEKNGTTVRAGPKRQNISLEGKSVTTISAGLLREGETVVEKERKKGTRKRHEHFLSLR